MINKIEIYFVPKEKQRLACYRKEGCADYFIERRESRNERLARKAVNVLVINVTKTKNWRHEWLILLHEIVELILVLHSGVIFKEIDRFDEQMTDYHDPGSHPAAPYHKAHMTALKIEKEIAKKLKIKWGSY
jgi:hypothetical protein